MVQFGKLITNRRKIDDGRGDSGGTSNDIGAEHRQIKARIGKEDAMKDLQPESKSCDFQVQFAQPAAGMHLIGDEQSLAIQRADDLLEVSRQHEWIELRKAVPALTNASSQSHHQRVHLLTARGRWHQSDP